MASPTVSIPGLPTIALRHAVQEHITRWKDCLNPQDIVQINALLPDISRDEHVAQVQGQAPRPRRVPRWIGDHVVLFMEDYYPLVHRCLRAGFYLSV